MRRALVLVVFLCGFQDAKITWMPNLDSALASARESGKFVMCHLGVPVSTGEGGGAEASVG